jgi:hypothetical protein
MEELRMLREAFSKSEQIREQQNMVIKQLREKK